MNFRSVVRITAVMLAAATMACEKDDPVSIAPEQRFNVDPLFQGIDPGATQQLNATVGTNPVQVTWESSNPAAATVSASGLVTGVAPGFAAITATQVADPSQKISSNISVLAPIAGSVELTNGVPLVVSSTGAAGSQKLYRITVPAGKTQLTVTTSGPAGGPDVDLLVRKSLAPVVPTSANPAGNFACYSGEVDANESCTISNPAPGTWYISLWLFQQYSGVTLTAKYTP